MAIRGIVFDMDGTLVDSMPLSFRAFNHGIRHITGKDKTRAEIIATLGGPERQIFAQLVGEAHVDVAMKMYRDAIDATLHEMALFDGIPELLENLDASGIPCSIFTGRTWETTEMILRHHRLLNRFITVVPGDHVSKPKPSAEGLHLALSRMNLEPHEVMLIGDSGFDMRAAHEAGSIGVAALWDPTADVEDLKREKPHHWAKTPSDIESILRTL